MTKILNALGMLALQNLGNVLPEKLFVFPKDFLPRNALALQPTETYYARDILSETALKTPLLRTTRYLMFSITSCTHYCHEADTHQTKIKRIRFWLILLICLNRDIFRLHLV